MGDAKESPRVAVQAVDEPFDLVLVKIVGRLVEEKDVLFLEKHLGQESLLPLARGKLGEGGIQFILGEGEAVDQVADFLLKGIEAAIQKLFLEAGSPVQGLFVPVCPFFVETFHLLFLFEKGLEDPVEVINDRLGSPFFEFLVEIRIGHAARPADLALVGDELPGEKLQKGALPGAVMADEDRVFALVKLEGNVVVELFVRVGKGEVFHC